MLQHLLRIVGDPQGLLVLDAGCGEGYVGLLLGARGAKVTGIDISPGLVDTARTRDQGGSIEYQVHDLSQPLPELMGDFDLVVSNMVLNDVPDYRGFVETLGAVTRSGGRVVLSMNNPYSAVGREKVKDYFDSGVSIVYYGMASTTGIKTFYHHRTLEEYVDAFRGAGFLLRTLCDACPPDELVQKGGLGAARRHFSPFMVLEFIRQ